MEVSHSRCCVMETRVYRVIHFSTNHRILVEGTVKGSYYSTNVDYWKSATRLYPDHTAVLPMGSNRVSSNPYYLPFYYYNGIGE